MTELGRRLRNDAKRGNPGWHIPCNRQCHEAAARIEELEEALEEIVGISYEMGSSKLSRLIRMELVARTALGDNDE